MSPAPIEVEITVTGATPSTTVLVARPGPEGRVVLFAGMSDVARPGPDGRLWLFPLEGLGHPFTEEDLPVGVRGSAARVLVRGSSDGAEALTEALVGLVGLLYQRGAQEVHCVWQELEAGERASALEASIEVFAERWNKVATQGDLDRLVAEMARAAESLAAEEIVAYATRPPFRDLLLQACVAGRVRERFGAVKILPSGSGT